jgi:hypothetical protein
MNLVTRRTDRRLVVVALGEMVLAPWAAGCRSARIPPALEEVQSRPIPTTRKELTKQLEVMVEVDQTARRGLMDAPNGFGSSAQVSELAAIDRANTERMKKIVAAIGWPTISEYGEKISNWSWLLVQHADAQPEFQEHCLELMRPLVERDEVSKSNYAYLTDRVLLARGKKQVYGTQMHTVNGELTARPMIDPENVDARRKEMGLVPMAEYKTWFNN